MADDKAVLWLREGVVQAVDRLIGGLDPEDTEDPEAVLAAVRSNAGFVAMEELAAPENRAALCAWLVSLPGGPAAMVDALKTSGHLAEAGVWDAPEVTDEQVPDA